MPCRYQVLWQVVGSVTTVANGAGSTPRSLRLRITGSG